jgi:SAM-dependent methyltransferase
MTPVAEPVGLASFSAVDSEPDANALVAALDEQAAVPAIQRLHAIAVEMAGIRIGHRVADVGCGTGDVARALAATVGADGWVVGIDASGTMLAEARRRVGAAGLPLEFRSGDVTDLDDPDCMFDATLCERVLQHVDNPEGAIAELVRVTRPGGRIVVIDTDWGMHAVHGADPRLTASIVDAWRNNAANGLSGRRLPALFADAGIRAVTVAAETMTSTDPGRPLLPPFTTMAASAERCGAIAVDEGQAWLAQLADAGQRGRFFWAVTMFAVSGTRP